MCFMGFALAGATLWRWKGRPDREQVKQHLSTSMPERYSRIEVGPVGQAARSIASGAAASIPEHEGLKNLQAGLKQQFNPEYRPYRAGAGPPSGVRTSDGPQR